MSMSLPVSLGGPNAMFSSSRFAKAPINSARFPHASSHRFNPLFRDRSGLHSGFRLPGKHHIRRQHLPRGRGTCRMRRLSFDF
jgi:hypothetical protein